VRRPERPLGNGVEHAPARLLRRPHMEMAVSMTDLLRLMSCGPTRPTDVFPPSRWFGVTIRCKCAQRQTLLDRHADSHAPSGRDLLMAQRSLTSPRALVTIVPISLV
jgi:hypothetical protein